MLHSLKASALASSSTNVLNDRIHVLQTRWESYVAGGTFECFIEFAVAVSCFAEHFNRMRLSGLVRLCEGLENATLARLATPASHPLASEDMAALQRLVGTLLAAVSMARPVSPERRVSGHAPEALDSEWVKTRTVWLVVGDDAQEMVEALGQQLNFFGFQTRKLTWGDAPPSEDVPLAVLFIPSPDLPNAQEPACIAAVRATCGASQLIYLGAHPAIETIVALMRSGIDLTIPRDEGSS